MDTQIPVTVPPVTSTQTTTPPVASSSQQPFVGLIEAIKAAYALMFRNSHLGYLIKSIILTKLVMIPIILLTWISLGTYLVAFIGDFIRVPKSPFQPPFESDVIYQVPTSNNYYDRITSIPQTSPNRFYDTKKGTSFNLGSLLVSLLGAAFGVITTLISLRAVDDIGQDRFQKMKDLFKGSLKFILPMWGLNFLTMIIIILGYLLLIIPGIIFGYMFFFAPMILLYENVGPIEALKRSKNLVNGYKMNLALKMFGGSLLAMLFVIPAALAFAWSGMIIFELMMPFGLLVQYVLYRDLRRIKGI